MTITLHNYPGVNHVAERNTLLKEEENDRSGLVQYLKRDATTHKLSLVVVWYQLEGNS
jgi:hypothetical protein